MNPMGPTTYTMVKLEQEHRLARLEHRRRQLEGSDDEQPKVHRQHVSRPRLTVSRRLVAAVATATGLLALAAGAALAFPG